MTLSSGDRAGGGSGVPISIVITTACTSTDAAAATSGNPFGRFGVTFAVSCCRQPGAFPYRCEAAWSDAGFRSGIIVFGAIGGIEGAS